MIVDLPVSRFSKKILTKTLSQPVPIKARDVIFHFFTDIKIGKPYRFADADKLLNDTVQVDMSEKIPKRSIPYLYQGALILHKYHLENMMTFVESQVLNGTPATTAIEQFRKIYEVTEDDIYTDTVLKKWQRWRKVRKTNISEENHNKKTNGSVILTSSDVNTFDITEIHNVLSQIVYDNLDYFVTTNKKFRFSLLRHVKIYIYRNQLKYDADGLAEIFELTNDGVYYAARNVQNLVDYDPVLGGKIKELIS